MKHHYFNDQIIELCDNNHLTVDDIFSKISESHPSAGRSSIYRNVEQLVTEGKLQKITGIWKKAYFEKSKTSHIHIIDENTWEIRDLDAHSLDIPWLPDNFEVSQMDIKIYGNFA